MTGADQQSTSVEVTVSEFEDNAMFIFELAVRGADETRLAVVASRLDVSDARAIALIAQSVYDATAGTWYERAEPEEKP